MTRPVLVLDIGGTKIAAGVDHTGAAGARVTHTATRPTHADRGGEAVLAQVIAAAREVLAAATADDIHPDRIGIASAGVIDPDTGDVTYASDLMPTWGGTALASSVSDALGLEAVALNDVHAHALGEATLGAGRGHRRVLVVAAGTGLGGALITDGVPDRGALGVAGSIAHIPHPAAAGLTCACGATTGHIECVTSGTGQATLFNRHLPAGLTPASGGGEVYQRSVDGCTHAQATLARSAAALGQTLASVAALLDPDAIILTGSATRSGDCWWQGLRDGFTGDALPLQRGIPLLAGTLGGDAPLIGAAIWARAGARRGTT